MFLEIAHGDEQMRFMEWVLAHLNFGGGDHDLTYRSWVATESTVYKLAGKPALLAFAKLTWG